MRDKSTRKSILIIFLVAFSIITSTLVISLVARGYQLNLTQGISLKVTGILSATSKPKGASVYLNDQLVTATDDTLNLSPDTYTVKITKDGYLPWQKNIVIKKETVYQTDTQLFRSTPDLKPITLTGAINPQFSPDGTKIVYSVASASATKDNGLYIIELNNFFTPLTGSSPRQLSQNLSAVNWSKFTFTFSPNSRQILATNKNINYLIFLDNPIPKTFTDITSSLDSIKKDWQVQTNQIVNNKLNKLPPELQSSVSTASAQDIQFSSSETKILYLTQTDSILPNSLITPPPAQSTQTQSRNLKKGNYYVYDLEDDTNFLLGDQKTIINPSWIPNSDNILFISNQKINIIDYDSTNKQSIFSGNFDTQKVSSWPDGTKIIIFSSPYTSAVPNLYTLSIK